jgi:hypothetical protein
VKKRYIDCGLVYKLELTMNNEEQLPLFDNPYRLTPKQVVKMLKEKGTIVSILQAEEILKLMRKMAKIVVSNYLNQNKLNTDQDL